MFDVPIDLQTAGKLILGSLPALVTLVGLSRGPGAVRSRLRHDIELLKELPEETDARAKFETYVSGQIDRFTRYETEASRDISGLVISGVLVLGLGALALWLLTLDHWWWLILGVGIGVFALAGLSSMYDSAQKIPRDAKGKRL